MEFVSADDSVDKLIQVLLQLPAMGLDANVIFVWWRNGLICCYFSARMLGGKLFSQLTSSCSTTVVVIQWLHLGYYITLSDNALGSIFVPCSQTSIGKELEHLPSHFPWPRLACTTVAGWRRL